MKNILFLSCLLFMACNRSEQAAQTQLEQVQQLYENNQFNVAKQKMDELKSNYPTAYATQKEALALRRRIELKEQERNLLFCDSLLPVCIKEVEKIKQNFVFEKKEYDPAGQYTAKCWDPETTGNYLQTTVNEAGKIIFTSVYQSNRPLKHNQIKLAIASGEYIETQTVPYDGGLNYRFRDTFGNCYEYVSFSNGRDNGAVAFIYQNAASKISLQYLGGTSQPTRILSEKEKKVIIEVCNLASILSEINQLQQEKIKAEKRIAYLHDKLKKL
ncbi:MAG: hypothetical protein LBS25_08380 [Candidatus Symbiothrix sp.]|jgi:hypothetical protein|nr:hypothetical protein [Candidatus Symbiothrix sp.]